MVQKDKQPEWFPEAKVRPDPSSGVPARPGPGAHAHREVSSLVREIRGNPFFLTGEEPHLSRRPFEHSPFPPSQVFCNGEEVMTVGGTQAEYVVDIWSGNHPFFLASPPPS